MAASFDNPEHWRSRAEAMRALVEDMTDRVAKATMLELADQYEHLALGAEQRLQTEKPAA
jgi:hypothetical protein